MKDPVVAAHATVGKKASKATPLAAVDREVTSPFDDPDVSQTIRELARQEMDALRAAGFEIESIDDGLLYKAGTTLWEIGQENLKHYAQEARKMPLLVDVATTHEAAIAEEARKDYPIVLADYRIDASGWIRRVEIDKTTKHTSFQKEGAPISEVAFGQLRGFYEGFQKKLALKRKKDKKAEAVSKAISKEVLPVIERDPGRGNVNAWIGKLETKQARMRARTVAGQREVFAFTGYSEKSKQTYTPFDTDKLLWEAARLAPEGVRCDLKYDIGTARMRARCTLLAPIDIPSFNGVGRIHQIGFDLCSGDDGTMGIFVNPFVIRTKCRNATLVQQDGVKSNFRHVGGFEGLKGAVATAIGNAGEAITSVRDVWASAAGNFFLDEETGEKLDVEETIKRLVYGEYVPMGGVTAEEAVENYLRAWKAEEGVYSAQGIIMAIQRAAHEGSWQTKWADEDIEEAASKLLYVKVYTLPGIEKDSEEVSES